MTALVLGGGVTGLGAGMASGFPVLEAADHPGGLCSSYYMRPGETARTYEAPKDGEAFRFELGGGHWIFGGDPDVCRLLNRFSPLATYERKAAVFFPARGTYAPYPLQNHAEHLGDEVAARVRAERSRTPPAAHTFREWLAASFGPTLCREFFFPFHELYTAGLSDRIAPQDAYKSPSEPSSRGYNSRFAYPAAGLDALVRGVAGLCDVRYGSRVTRIDPRSHELYLDDGRCFGYSSLISTLPLNRTLEIADITVEAPQDPWTSVLVLNIGAVRGDRCPDAHWVYVPASRSGFHRVGFYDNVDPSFLPRGERARHHVTSLYVERAFVAESRPSTSRVDAYTASVVAELREWGYIGEPLLVDPTWTDVAYTWAWPASTWRSDALEALRAHDIAPVGRYGRWVFQGIADSIRDGLVAGAVARRAW